MKINISRTGKRKTHRGGQTVKPPTTIPAPARIVAPAEKFRLRNPGSTGNENGRWLYASNASTILVGPEGDDERYYWYWIGPRLFNASFGTCLTLVDREGATPILSPFSSNNNLQLWKYTDEGRLAPTIRMNGQDNWGYYSTLYIHNNVLKYTPRPNVVYEFNIFNMR